MLRSEYVDLVVCQGEQRKFQDQSFIIVVGGDILIEVMLLKASLFEMYM